MIVTVTPNTGIDQTLFIPSFHLNRTIRASESHLGMGGKGASVSWILGRWGVPNLALGFAAGCIGEQMDAMLRDRGVETDFTWVDGSTRWNPHIVCSDGSGQTTITTASLDVSSEHVETFQKKFQAVLPKTSCLVLSGTLPINVPLNFYPDLIQKAKENHVPVILDSSGPFLRSGLEARPTLIKPNRPELEELCGESASSQEDVFRLASLLQEKYAVNVIVTLGKDGAFALIGSDRYRIPAIPVQPVSTAGAGDAVIAGMAAALSQKLPPEEGLRLSFGLATASLLTPATGDFRPADAQSFLSQVLVLKL